jgi:hypothetical protein
VQVPPFLLNGARHDFSRIELERGLLKGPSRSIAERPQAGATQSGSAIFWSMLNW